MFFLHKFFNDYEQERSSVHYTVNGCMHSTPIPLEAQHSTAQCTVHPVYAGVFFLKGMLLCRMRACLLQALSDQRGKPLPLAPFQKDGPSLCSSHCSFAVPLLVLPHGVRFGILRSSKNTVFHTNDQYYPSKNHDDCVQIL